MHRVRRERASGDGSEVICRAGSGTSWEVRKESPGSSGKGMTVFCGETANRSEEVPREVSEILCKIDV